MYCYGAWQVHVPLISITPIRVCYVCVHVTTNDVIFRQLCPEIVIAKISQFTNFVEYEIPFAQQTSNSHQKNA